MPRQHGGPNEIVPANNILQFQAILNEDWRQLTLLPAINNIDDCLHWLASRQLLKNLVICNCGVHLSLNSYNTGIDTKRWKCPQCGIRKSLRDGSFFSKSHINLQRLILIIYFWATDISRKLLAMRFFWIYWTHHCRLV